MNMAKEKNYHIEEEEFFIGEEKQSRKQRKYLREKDRSKFKKTDQAKLLKKEEKTPPSDKTLKGRIISITREKIFVSSENKIYLCTLRGVLQKEKTRKKSLLAVGDIVHFTPLSHLEGTIEFIEKRYSILSRVELLRKKEQIIAVNIDQVFITVSLIKPPLKPALVDRYIIAAQKGNMQPIILINKIDLVKTDLQAKQEYKDFLSAYEALGIPILSVSAKEKTGINALKKLMENKASCFSGQSGVGKSSLINAALGKKLKTGDIVKKTFKGAHITTKADLIPLEKGGFCIDTPGIKSFGLWELKKEEIESFFPEIKKIGKNCKFLNCTHDVEPNCAVKKAVEKEIISPLRFASFRSLMKQSIEKQKTR